ncbi:MAG: toll/interleukin-1 receptor domain-containing protein [Proteobacteria bacterium]|nr:toll/interleukin-1 receptor domain-containing protein [Pseudomonadota bacterium]
MDKDNLIKKISVELDRQLVLSQIKEFLNQYNIETPLRKRSMSIITYVTDRLRGVNEANLKNMAGRLGIDTSNSKKPPPKIDTTPVKAFISHADKDKNYANALRRVFKKYDVDAFVSGVDIKGGDDGWERIKSSLNAMKFFIALHSDDFSISLFCQQEVGFALKRNVKIIPIDYYLKERPKSFIQGKQYIKVTSMNVETMVKKILTELKDTQKTRKLYYERIADKMSKAIGVKILTHKTFGNMMHPVFQVNRGEYRPEEGDDVTFHTETLIIKGNVRESISGKIVLHADAKQTKK